MTPGSAEQTLQAPSYLQEVTNRETGALDLTVPGGAVNLHLRFGFTGTWKIAHQDHRQSQIYQLEKKMGRQGKNAPNTTKSNMVLVKKLMALQPQDLATKCR